MRYMKKKTSKDRGETMKKYELIEEFILAVQEEYPQLDMRFDYNEITEVYDITFDTTESDYPRKEVEEVIHDFAEGMLVGEGVFNFFICHGLAFTKE